MQAKSIYLLIRPLLSGHLKVKIIQMPTMCVCNG